MKKISKIQYITNGKSADEIFNEVHEVIDAGVDWVQLRIKNQELDFLNIGEEVKAICKGRATLIINDQVSVAKDLDVEGVHLGLTDMPIDLARNVLGSNKIIGATANTILQCKKHYDMGANYIGLGPYKYTKTKEKLSPILGIEGYKGKNAAQLFAKLPVLAHLYKVDEPELISPKLATEGPKFSIV